MNDKKILPMKEVLWLVCHCTATKPNVNLTVEDLDRMHAAKGWVRCGYHWLVLKDGTIQAGRPEIMAGAHLRHYNQHAIGICYVGGLDKNGKSADTRTPEQKAALHFLLKDLKEAYPQAKICGHRDFPHVAKDCPCFDAAATFADLNAMYN